MSFHLNRKNLSSNFPGTILDRGINYLHQGRVQNLTFENGNQWTATVHGSEAYRIQIQPLDSSVIVKADCNCPYAETSPCKHIAAVLLAMEDEDAEWLEGKSEVEGKSPKTVEDDFTNLLESATREELIEAIKKAAIVDSKLEDHITAMMKTGKGFSGKTDYRKIVKKALAPARRKGLMYGSEARRHLVPVYELLEQAEELKRSGSIRDVLDISQVIMEEMVPALQFIDDSNADVGESLRWATQLLFECCEQPPEKEQSTFFKWCLKSLDDERYEGWDFEDDFLAMAVGLAQTDKQIAAISSLMDEKIRTLEKDTDGWSARYRLQQTILQKARLLRKTDDVAAADALLENYSYFTGVYAKRIDIAWQREEVNRVKELAEAAIERFEKQAPGLKKEWDEWLMKVAEKQGSPGELLDRSMDLLREDPGMERYVKVKSLIPENEWDQFLKKNVLSALRLDYMGRRLLPEIFALEEMWEELLAEIKKVPNIYDLEQYQHHFNERGEFPAVEDIFEIYEQIIWDSLEQRADRKNYRKVCRILKKVIAFGAAEQTKELVGAIRDRYSNRPSLLEELDRYGF
ncbi:SWIM zinc finger family protein [Rhodohalobacter sp.]|uniref:SWIM zinc finger family protein n=1 Tax=Rhodohalobacter sp. TaxID=1974210 RepID=UPI002ACD5E5F|nr:SWIM zinc finger family protein [Rhodohalobacter sp.]MDZ7756743.1 SWIM zinc finger family protein [Rhodohalobacter sp.]